MAHFGRRGRMKVAIYVRVSTKKQDETLMTKEEFFAKIDRAEEQFMRGEGKRFSNREEMNQWLNSL